jgi:Zn-finger nucleic acid-binding protein
VQCPKDRKTELVDGVLADGLAVKCCPDCKGTWIPLEDYETWQSHQPAVEVRALPTTLNVDYVQSPYDTKAALCPACSYYLSRAKVSLKTPFYVERCSNCGGVWCDRGEWEILERLGLHTSIERLFTSEWQTKVKEQDYAEKERRATVEKLGDELAARVFELAELLENHPNGDFGVAYLMRRFEK